MKRGIDIGQLKLSSDTYIVGAQAAHTVSFKTPVPLEDGMRIYIQIPDEIGTPMQNQLNTTSTEPFANTFDNWIIGNKVTIVVAINPALNITTIEEGTEL